MEDDSFRNRQKNIFDDLYTFQAEDVLVPVSMTQFIDIENSYSEIIELIRETKFSCYPVYRDGVDDIIGILKIKDLLFCGSDSIDINSLLLQPLFISENKTLSSLCLEFVEKNLNFAIVVDEHGSVRGIVTYKDILSFLVDHQKTEVLKQYVITKVDGSSIIDAVMPLDDFNANFGTTVFSEEYDTIGGYLIEQFTYVPQVGEVLKLDSATVTVKETQGAKLLKLIVDSKL
ncbi:MAG: transporter associated domain-containing protein [Brevinemataceae bacterium]